MPGEVYLGHVTVLFLASKGITTDCQSGCLSLYTHQLCNNFLYQAQDIFILSFLLVIILTRVRKNFNVVLICNFLVNKEGEHLVSVS